MQVEETSDNDIDKLNVRSRQDYDERFSCMIASETVLAREWLTAEEDEAWKHL